MILECSYNIRIGTQGVPVEEITGKFELLEDVLQLIEQSKHSIASYARGEANYLFWSIGKAINDDVLNNERADYGKQIVSRLATQLRSHGYGRSYEVRNIRRMMQFATQFPDWEIVSPFATHLSWSHIVELLPLKGTEAKLFYAKQASDYLMSRDDLRAFINRKAFERSEIANAKISDDSIIPLNTFKDPYLLDVLGLDSGFLEDDLETAILKELERFILEFGKGFAFVACQKRMIIDNKDYHLDLLFYSRPLKRLVAVELKQGKFEAEYNGQMKLYLKWLNRYERQGDENEPIGLILCAEGNRQLIELMDLDKDGILVAEYWTTLPPKAEFEKKIRSLLVEARARYSKHHHLLNEGNAGDE
jgi:predicted nuclease of restriction endonuclease-like (RecB) superfamily